LRVTKKIRRTDTVCEEIVELCSFVEIAKRSFDSSMSMRQPSVNLIAEADPYAIEYLETNFPAVGHGSAETS